MWRGDGRPVRDVEKLMLLFDVKNVSSVVVCHRVVLLPARLPPAPGVRQAAVWKSLRHF